MQSLQVFTALAEAEAKVHGKTVDEVHFHEVGAIDTIIDIAGCVLALEYLGIEKIFVSNIHTGNGFVNCAHGLMPVPAPATAELLQGLQHSHRKDRKRAYYTDWCCTDEGFSSQLQMIFHRALAAVKLLMAPGPGIWKYPMSCVSVSANWKLSRLVNYLLPNVILTI